MYVRQSALPRLPAPRSPHSRLPAPRSPPCTSFPALPATCTSLPALQATCTSLPALPASAPSLPALLASCHATSTRRTQRRAGHTRSGTPGRADGHQAGRAGLEVPARRAGLEVPPRRTGLEVPPRPAESEVPARRAEPEVPGPSGLSHKYRAQRAWPHRTRKAGPRGTGLEGPVRGTKLDELGRTKSLSAGSANWSASGGVSTAQLAVGHQRGGPGSGSRGLSPAGRPYRAAGRRAGWAAWGALSARGGGVPAGGAASGWQGAL